LYVFICYYLVLGNTLKDVESLEILVLILLIEGENERKKPEIHRQ
jgi:hypothetical protein